MIARSIGVLLGIVLISTSYAADSPKIKFGKVSKEDLQMAYSPVDSSASAVVLADFGNTRINYSSGQGFKLVFTRHRRIKIFNSSGYDWADVLIPLYRDGSDREVISQIKGYTFNLENGKVVKSKLKNDGKFIEEYDENHQIHKFTLPNVKEGSVIEYTYQISSDFLFNLQDWEFQSSIPTLWSEYEVTIPEYFVYKPLSQGYYPFVVNDRSKSSGTYNIVYKTQGNGRQPAGSPHLNRETRQEQISYSATDYRWAAQNVPALIEEPYVTTMDDYVLKIEMELASVQIPGELHKNYTTTWEQIDKQLLKSNSFGDVIKSSNAVKNLIASLNINAKSADEKISAIYRYVQHNIHWNQRSRKFADQSLRKTLEEQSGSSADINLLLVAMLREAGIKAEPVVLSTRSHGMLRKSFPRLNQFNYVVAMASMGEGHVLLDATDTACPPGILPVRCINQEGRVVSEGSGNKWINLRPTKGAKQATMTTLHLENGQLIGSVSSSHAGYDAMRVRRNVGRENGVEGYLAKMKENSHSWAIQDYQIESLETIGKPIKENYQVVFQEAVQETGDLIYLNPNVMGRLEENPFKSEFRAYPVDYPYPEQETFMLTFTIPEGYQVDELPTDMIIALPDKGGRYSFTIKQMGTTLQIVSRLSINRMKFYAQEYPNLRQFFNLIVSKQEEQIVLKKIDS